MKKHLTRVAACLLTGVLALGAFVVNTVHASDELVIATASLGPSLDPIATNDMPSARKQRQIFDTLLKMVVVDGEVELLPGLAVEWEFDDPANLRLQLREDVYFHNGDLFTAADVKFSIERSLESPHSAPIVEMIESVTIVGDHEVIIHAVAPFAPLLLHLTHTATAIVSERAVTEMGDDEFGVNPVGTGPFMFESLVVQSELVLSRFDGYWGDAPAFQTMRFLEIPVQPTRLILVETGGAHIAMDIAPADLDRAEANADVVINRGFNFSLNPYIGFNTQREPFDNHLVRQAFNYAIDTQAIVDVVFRGVGRPAQGPLTELVWGFAPQEPFDHNVERARELMAEAGFPDGFHTSIWWNTNSPQRGQITEMLQFMLMDIGVTLDIVGVEWGQYLEDTAEGLHDMFLLGWVTVTGDPDYGLFNVFHSANFGAAGNRTFYYNPEIDRLLEAGRLETDADVRLEIYAEIQAILREDSPWIPILQGEELHVSHTSVQGFEFSPTGHHWLWTISFGE